MKTLIGFLTLVTGLYTANASAQFVRCEMDYAVGGAALGIEVGAGSGQITCWDSHNFGYRLPVNVTMVGGGLKAGLCQTTGHISSAGLGIAVDNFLSIGGKVELGAMVPGGCSVGPGANVNIAGLNASGTVSQACYSGPCAGPIDGQILAITKAPGAWTQVPTPPPPAGYTYQPQWYAGGFYAGVYHQPTWYFHAGPQPIHPRPMHNEESYYGSETAY